MAHADNPDESRYQTTTQRTYVQHFTTKEQLDATQKMPPYQQQAQYPRRTLQTTYQCSVGAADHGNVTKAPSASVEVDSRKVENTDLGTTTILY